MEVWQGKVAVVTGATSGIGGAICTALCRAGMTVCGIARRKDKIEELRLQLFGSSGHLFAVACDITSEEAIKQSFNWIEKTLGGIDLLVNNAGVRSNAMLLDDGNTKELRGMLEANLLGLCLCTREAIKLMGGRDVAFGHVVNVNSIFGQKVNTCVPGAKPINGMYPACKFAVTALTECLRQEVNFLGVKVKVTVSGKTQWCKNWMLLNTLHVIVSRASHRD